MSVGRPINKKNKKMYFNFIFGTIVLQLLTIWCVSGDEFWPIEHSIYNILSASISISERKHTDQMDNELCIKQLTELNKALQNRDNWAVSVIDAWGKIPSGLLSGNFIELGTFDQCLNVYYDTKNDARLQDVGIIKGQYCLSMLNLSNLLTNGTNQQAVDSMNSLGPMVAMCIPNVCSAEMIEQLINDYLNQSFIRVPDSLCQESEPVIFTGLDIFAITFFSTIVVLLISSTIYDIFLTRSNLPRKPILIAFSMYTNGGKIFKCTKSTNATTDRSDTIDCLNGIRSLSIIWIVLGHGFGGQILTPNVNLFYILEWSEQLQSSFVFSATMAVDTFFLISGMLVTWSLLRHLTRTNGRMNVPILYVHRYLRLTPPLAAAILFTITISNHITNGPLKSVFMSTFSNCTDWWWTTLLYIQNYVNPDDLCLIHSWYLSVDMQLFIVSPIFIYALWRWRVKFVWVIPIIIALSMACTFATYIVNGFTASKLDRNVGKNGKTYYATHTRMSVYFIGMLLGYLFYILRNRKLHLIKGIIIFGWCLSLVSIVAIVLCINIFQQRSEPATVLASAFFETFSRTGWAILVAWIVLMCHYGYGGPINVFLSLPQWQPLSRLSYSLYIVHVPLQYMILASRKYPLYFSDILAIHSFWGDFGISLTIAVFWSMAFESPVVGLEKILFGSKQKQSKTATATTAATWKSTYENGAA